MENFPYMISDCYIPAVLFSPDSRKLRLVFSDPEFRPPVLDEMMPDIERLASSLAQIRQDSTCYALNFSDLVSECMLKLSSSIHKDRFDRIRTRKEAFKFIKTMFNNHLKSLVAKHRLTRKRGYTKEDADGNPAPKNVDLSLDDPEQPVHISDHASGWSTSRNFVQDVAPYLTSIEFLILKEFDEPGANTRLFADLDYLESDPSKRNVVKISEKHHALGLGLEFSVFKKILQSLRTKITYIQMKEATPAEIAWNTAISRLEEVFSIVIPCSVEKPIVRRLLTLAAVDQFDKVDGNDQIIKDLQFIGAKIPEKRAGATSCFGIMFQSRNQTCSICGAARACQEEACNHGLGDITIDPRLLGAKQMRIPTLVSGTKEPFPILNLKEEEIYHYLMENFNPQNTLNGMIFNHRDVRGISVTVVRVPNFEIRIDRPSLSIEDRLVKSGKYFIIPGDISAEDTIDILGTYSHDAFITMTC